MDSANHIILSRQLGVRNEMGILANNLANIDTSGYRQESMMFREYLQRTQPRYSLSFTQDFGLARDISPGKLTSTGNPLDVAINGQGFFVVDTPTGERYTRAGQFHLNLERQITTAEGFPVQGEGGGAIILPEAASGEIIINKDGSIIVGEENIGQLRVVTFQDERSLRRQHDSMYISLTEQPENKPNPQISQGMLEGSNVESILELTRMIEAHRSYGGLSTYVQKHDDLQRSVVRTLGRLSA